MVFLEAFQLRHLMDVMWHLLVPPNRFQMRVVLPMITFISKTYKQALWLTTVITTAAIILMLFEFARVLLEKISPARKSAELSFLSKIESDPVKLELLKAS